MTQFFDQYGNRVSLGSKLGTGGEATAYHLDGDPQRVVKIYHSPVDAVKSTKLSIMASMSRPELLRFAAWPQSTVVTHRGGSVVGIIMPKVQGREIHTLYNPASRKAHFPKADWRFLIHTAFNFATAVETLHQSNIVLGDINQGNALVNEQSLVYFIDCDSFQIKSSSNVFRCTVGVPHFTPPELQNCRFSEIDRSQNHDRFGLAIMIFHLLFAGRHPFVGRFGGNGDLPIEKAIEESRFAFGKNRRQFLMEPPPNSPIMEDLPPELADLFERAFGPNSGRNNERPSASQWASSLRTFESKLTQCSVDPGHYLTNGQKCPWCRIANGGGPNFFVSVSYDWFVRRIQNFDLNQTWRSIETAFATINGLLSLPRPDGTLMVGKPIPVVADTTKALRLAIVIMACVLGGIAAIAMFAGIPSLMIAFGIFSTLFGVAWVFMLGLNPRIQEKRLRAFRVKEMLGELDSIDREIKQSVVTICGDLRLKHSKLSLAKNKLGTLDAQKTHELQRLGKNASERQRTDFLKSKFLSDHKISGIGSVRLAALESYGIETAFDVTFDRVITVPGIGDQLAYELVAWRDRIELGFTFDITKGVPQSDIQAVELRYAQEKIRLQKELMEGVEHMQKLVAICRDSVSNVLARRKVSLQRTSQAIADFDIMQ